MKQELQIKEIPKGYDLCKCGELKWETSMKCRKCHSKKGYGLSWRDN